MKRTAALILAAAMLLSLAACGGGAQTAPSPEPTAEPTPGPTVFDTASLRSAAYVLRPSGADAARLRTREEPSCETLSSDVPLSAPLRIRMADASVNGLGTVVLLEAGAAPLRQAMALCEGLTLSGDGWPAIEIDESYALPLTLEGGAFGDLRLDGGDVTIRRSFLSGLVKIRGGAVVRFEDCVFGESAVVCTSDGPVVTADGEDLLFGPAELPEGLTADRVRPGVLSSADLTIGLPVVELREGELVSILPPPPVTPTPEPTFTPEPTAVPETDEEAGGDVSPTDAQAVQTFETAAPRNGIYYVMINVSCNTVTVYTRDEGGEFTVPHKVMVCSTGYDTPRSGVFLPGVQHRWHALFGDVYGQYTTQITGNILFHSVPYLTNGDPGSLEYWEYDKLGTTCSMGCVRLRVIDAKWIYDRTGQIAGIEFYSNADPGPLGKPGVAPISGNKSARGWDPSDPDGANPWTHPTPEPTKKPTATPKATPTAAPTAEPTSAPTTEPSVTPTAEPSTEPTEGPTSEPTAEPTAEPTEEPTAEPTTEPTATPTAEPTATPTAEPTATPTAEPTEGPASESGDGNASSDGGGEPPG